MILTANLILHRFAANVVHFAWPLAQFPHVHLIKKNKIYTLASMMERNDSQNIPSFHEIEASYITTYNREMSRTTLGCDGFVYRVELSVQPQCLLWYQTGKGINTGNVFSCLIFQLLGTQGVPSPSCSVDQSQQREYGP